MLNFKTVFIVLIFLLLISCENEKPRWVFNEDGSSNTEESDGNSDGNIIPDDETDDDEVVYEENETRRSNVRCGDEFGGYYEEIYLDGKWELTEKCLHPKFNVDLIDDMNSSNNDLIPIFMKDMGEKLFVYTVKKQGDELEPVMLTTDGTAAGTKPFCSNMKQSYRSSPYANDLVNNMTEINGNIYYMGLNETDMAFVLYLLNTETCESTDLTAEIEGFEPVPFSETFEDNFIQYNFSDILVVFSQSDKKAYVVNIETLTLEKTIENISSYQDNVVLGEKLFFQTQQKDRVFDLKVFNSSDMSVKTVISSTEGYTIEYMKFIKGESSVLVSLATLENGYALWKTDGTQIGTVLVEEDDEKIGELSFGKEVGGIFYYADNDGKIFKVAGDFSSVEKIVETDNSILGEEIITAGGKMYFVLNNNYINYQVNSYSLIDGKLISTITLAGYRPLILVNGENVSLISSEEDTSVAIYEGKDGSFIKTGTLINALKKISSHNNVGHGFRSVIKKDGTSIVQITQMLSDIHHGISDHLLTDYYLFRTDGTYSGTQLIDSKWEKGEKEWSLYSYMADFFGDSLILVKEDEKGDRYLVNYGNSGDKETLMRLKTDGTKDTKVELSVEKDTGVYYSVFSHNYESKDKGSLYFYNGAELFETDLSDTISYEESLDDPSFVDELRVVGDGIFAVRGKDLVYLEGQDVKTFSYDSKNLDNYWINLNYSNDNELYFSLGYSTIIDSVSTTRQYHFMADSSGVKEIKEINELTFDGTGKYKGFSILSKINGTLVLAADRSELKPQSAICFLSEDGILSWGPEDLLKVSNISYLCLDSKLIIFYGHTFEKGGELWVSDGTLNGTELLKDITPGKESSSYSWMFEKKDGIYFMADNKLWKTKGQPWSTEFVANATDLSYLRGKYIIFNEEVYFLGVKHVNVTAVDYNSELKLIRINDNGTTYQLWSDTIANIYIEIGNFKLSDGLMFFELSDSIDPLKYQEIFIADGRKDGVKAMGQMSSGFPVNNSHLKVSSEFIFFAGSSADHGNEPRKLTVTYE